MRTLSEHFDGKADDDEKHKDPRLGCGEVHVEVHGQTPIAR